MCIRDRFTGVIIVWETGKKTAEELFRLLSSDKTPTKVFSLELIIKILQPTIERTVRKNVRFQTGQTSLEIQTYSTQNCG